MTPNFSSEIRLPPVLKASGTVKLPGSKSISNRALMLAASAFGRTRLTGLLRADDTERMLESLTKLGVKVTADGDAAVIEGAGGFFPVKSAELFIGNAGTAARTLTAALAFAGGHYRLDGIERMRERPIGDLLAALRTLGADVTCEIKEGFLPLVFRPAVPVGRRVSVRGNVSSQYLTALLLTAPLIAPEEGLEITVEGELISRPYIDITLAMMKTFGADVTVTKKGFRVAKGGYRAQEDYAVEGDASGASYFLALGALTGGPVRVEGVGRNSLQGDAAFADVLEQMGAVITRGDRYIEASLSAGKVLKGITLDCTKIPDAAMTLVPMALKTEGAVRLTGIASWRVKETDRIAALRTELKKLGYLIEEENDSVLMWNGERCEPEETPVIATYEDHRMAMAFAPAVISCPNLLIADPQVVSKSYPGYWEDLKQAGFQVINEG